jgi:phosphatidylserine/phosphatidylglycerophosphate/cardiolipin synthase-like enzyme
VKRFLVACLFACATVGAGATAIPATGTVEVLFTPWDDAEGAIVRALGEARQGIHVQAFLLTSRSIARALREAHDRGVRVEVLADREMLRKGENSQLPMLAAAGIPVWLETRYASAHNKVLLIDGESPGAVVITGSYNFTGRHRHAMPKTCCCCAATRRWRGVTWRTGGVIAMTPRSMTEPSE